MAANDRQVGGNHYAQKEGIPQHWDLSAMYQWDGFQHCITKYVMRWKTKHTTNAKRLEDLKKAQHMIEKYIEVYTMYVPPEEAQTSEFRKLEEESSTYMSNENYQCEGGWGDGMQLYKCRRCRAYFKATGLEDAANHVCPQPPSPTGHISVVGYPTLSVPPGAGWPHQPPEAVEGSVPGA